MKPIDADALIAYCDEKWIPLNVDAVNAQPTIEPRAKGEWRMVYHNDYRTVGHIECDQCGYHTKGHMKYNFCPNCGADMRGEEE